MTSDMKLTWPELLLGAMVGSMREVSAISNNRPDKGEMPRCPWEGHIEGALAEMFVAKTLGVYWSGNLGDLQAADASVLQVRSTKYPTGRLMLHPEDKDDDWFVLVIGDKGAYRIAGCLKAKDGKRAEYWDETLPAPCYAVPQAAMMAMPASWWRATVMDF